MNLTQTPVIPVDIFTFMLEEFRAATKQPSSTITTTKVEDFVVWCQDYLAKNKPTQLITVSENYGVMLTNGKSFVLAPQASVLPAKGAMASNDVSIKI